MERLRDAREVLCHTFIVGEPACDNLKNPQEIMRISLSVILALAVCTVIASGLLVSWWVALAVGLLFLGSVGYVEKIFNVEVPKKPRILFLVIFVFLSLGSLIYSQYKEKVGEKASRASKGQIADLTKKESDLRHKIQQNEGDLESAKRQIADLTEKNDHLQQQSKEAQDAAAVAKAETKAFAEYGKVATYTFNGLQQSGQFLSPFTPVSKWTEGYLTVRNNKYWFKCTPDSIRHYQDLINESPKFPFPYLALSQCLLRIGDSSWGKYASKAQAILRKTTKIPLHSKDHDGWLEQVTKLLDPAQMKNVVVEGKIHKSE